MPINENRRLFIKKLGLTSLTTGSASVPSLDALYNSLWNEEVETAPSADLTSLPSTALFSVLDLSDPELAGVRKALERKGHSAALASLLDFYRNKYPREKAASAPAGERSFERADNLTRRIFQWGPYAAAEYGANMDWAADPAGDIEWVANVYRFAWAIDLTQAYRETGNEKYAQTFVEFTTDWIAKHPLEKTVSIVHPVYTHWKGYPWLDLQTGIRATNICSSFRVMVHAKSFTPAFLGVLLSSLYDHQVKTEKLPMAKVHNKAIFEQRGFFNVLHTFREFKDRDRWTKIAMRITTENLLAQTTTDGVQREWCGGYHSGVYRDAIEIDSRVRDLGLTMPDYYRSRVKAMAEHIFGISTPDLGFPMFGDTARKRPLSDDRSKWQLHNTLTEAARLFGEPKFQALADLDISRLPANGSVAFTEAGIYALRNEWSPAQVYMALHCSPRGITTHDTPDNGTFELYAYGRWLMPDSGYFTYGHDPKARAWHRQTKVHPTLTVNGNDTNFAGRQLLWQSDENNDVLCVENQSYQYFVHRRTVWFTDKKGKMPFFVILDEAIGDLNGDIEIHFPLAPGPVSIDHQSHSITTGFDDANLLIRVACKDEVTLHEEDGWHAWEYGKREKRTSVSARHKGAAPTTFVSLVVPYEGTTAPACRLLTSETECIAGKNPFTIKVEVAGKEYLLERRL